MFFSKCIQWWQHSFLYILFHTINYFKKALIIRLSKKVSSIELPPVKIEHNLSKKEMNKIVRSIDYILLFTMFWKPGRCFYRSYALATLLRKKGICTKLNFGFENIYEINGKVRAHCWVSFNDLPVAERTDPLLRFPSKFKMVTNDVQYWIGES